MASIPPPYSSRDHAQVQPGPATGAVSASASSSTSSGTQEFAETTSVCLEWRLCGLKAMYESTRGEQKSKCIKSAVFGDADNLWEVLWYPNAGSSNQTAGDHVSLYLSCVPTAQERESSVNGKWTRKGLWWFKFEVRPFHADSRGLKPEALAAKDASDHTFAVKTANWGWQAFAKRDALFQNPAVQATDSFMIVCTIQPQPQPPAGIWLGVGLQPSSMQVVHPNNRGVGSGGGLSAWASADGSCGGVAGGTAAAGGTRRVVPKDLISSVGSMLDDPLYSDIEFIIPGRGGALARRIYANKKLLNRCEYFEAMFHGGFREVEGVIEEEDSDDEPDMLSDSDMEDETELRALKPESSIAASPSANLHLTTTTSRASSGPRRASISGDNTASATASPTSPATATIGTAGTHGPVDAAEHESEGSEHDSSGAGAADITLESDLGVKEVQTKRGNKSPALPSASSQGDQKAGVRIGPAKTKVIVRDAAWSTWWAVLFWMYTDIIYFAPLSSSFEHNARPPPPPSTVSTATGPASGQGGAAAGVAGAGLGGATNISTSGTSADDTLHTRLEWIHQWMFERGIEDPTDSHKQENEDDDDDEEVILGPRPVSAKAVYRLADKLDLPALKIRAFQHICGNLTAANVPAEVFSRFSSTYEDVRRVQVAFFLKHWAEIKKSETMMQIWQQIRHGKHVGFEEVWPLIVGQLDFRPS